MTGEKNWDFRSSNINPITIYRLICAVLRWAAELAAGVGSIMRRGQDGENEAAVN